MSCARQGATTTAKEIVQRPQSFHSCGRAGRMNRDCRVTADRLQLGISPALHQRAVCPRSRPKYGLGGGAPRNPGPLLSSEREVHSGEILEVVLRSGVAGAIQSKLGIEVIHLDRASDALASTSPRFLLEAGAIDSLTA